MITGLRGGRVVVVNRAHHAMGDGISSLDILTLLLDTDPEGYRPEPAPPWKPRPAPSNWQLLKPMLWNVRSQPAPERTRLPVVWRTRRLPWTGIWKLGGTMVTRRPDVFFNRKLFLWLQRR